MSDYSPRFNSLSFGLNLFVLVGFVLLFFRYRESERALHSSLLELNEMRVGARIAVLEHGALVEAINNRGWDGTFLHGRSVTTNRDILFESVRDAVYYIIRSTCSACPLNYPAMTRLAREAPGRVFIVALDDSAVDLREYVSKFAQPAPTLSSASGRLLQNLPDYATPVTLLFRQGRLVSLVTGKVDERSEAFLLANLQNLPVE